MVFYDGCGVKVCMCVCIENGGLSYLRRDEVMPGVEGVAPQVTATLTTSFLVLIGIFFPSVTGGWGHLIMVGVVMRVCVCVCMCL